MITRLGEQPTDDAEPRRAGARGRRRRALFADLVLRETVVRAAAPRPTACAGRCRPRPATGSGSRCAARSSAPASSGAPTCKARRELQARAAGRTAAATTGTPRMSRGLWFVAGRRRRRLRDGPRPPRRRGAHRRRPAGPAQRPRGRRPAVPRRGRGGQGREGNRVARASGSCLMDPRARRPAPAPTTDAEEGSD